MVKLKNKLTAKKRKFNDHKSNHDHIDLNHGKSKKHMVFSKKIKTKNDLLVKTSKNYRHDKTEVSKTDRNSQHSSDNSDSEDDSFLQLVNAVSDNNFRNSVVSDESDLEDTAEVQNSTDCAPITSSEECESDHDSDNLDILSENKARQKIEKACIVEADDPFNIHFQNDLSDEMFDVLSSETVPVEEYIKTWPCLGNLKILIPKLTECQNKLNKPAVRIEAAKCFAKSGDVPSPILNVDWNKLHVKSQIHDNISLANSKHTGLAVSKVEPLVDLQKEIFSIVNSYQDLYYTDRSLENAEQIRFIYALHAVNHALKTRLKVIHHNTRLANKDSGVETSDDFRDQGLTRPKVLILVPFRDSALRIVEMMISILGLNKNGNVMNKKRFIDEFTGDEIAMPIKNPKPEDYERTFKGNTDDTFRIGISVTKKSFKLYADFYSADIIIASPLGLRVIIGAEGEAERDFDFLASIEVLILDQAEIFLMQNWDHLLHVFDHLHLQPRDSHGTNFVRVRNWALNGWSKYYRQTVVLAAHALPQISSLVTRKCHNYWGKVCVANPTVTGSICQVVLQLPQVFHRLDVESAVQCLDKRFDVFVNKILPQYKDCLMNHTLIYVPSYFDFVRLRNYFKKETISFTQICEYSKEGKIARARDMFYHSDAHFMLYSERFHFFRRIRLKGIRHIVFYQPPTFPHFYSELCNFMQDLQRKKDPGGETSMSVTVLYSKFDAPQLAAIVGSVRAGRMLSSDRNIHMFMTGD